MGKTTTCHNGRAPDAGQDGAQRLMHSLKRMPDGRFEAIPSGISAVPEGIAPQGTI